VKLHLRESTNAQRGESVVVLQVSERAINSGASTVEVAEPLRVSGDARKQPTAKSERQRWLLRLCATERDDGFAPSAFNLSATVRPRSGSRPAFDISQRYLL
jgi:glycine/D-amino acid oxidase-like deaminating enzyme